MKLEKVIAKQNGKTVYEVGDKCVKVFDEGYAKSRVLKEAANHSAVEETGLNVPKLLEVVTVDGKWAIVYELVKGKTLAQLAEEDYSKKGEYLELMVDLQMQIHAKSSKLLARTQDELHDDIRATDFNATTRYDLHNLIDTMARSATVCHGDLKLSNVILCEDGKVAITGWAYATKGDPYADVSKTYLSFWMRGDISGAEKYLEIYCQKSGVDKAKIDWWTPIMAAAMTSKCNEKEREFLLSLVNKNYNKV